METWTLVQAGRHPDARRSWARSCSCSARAADRTPSAERARQGARPSRPGPHPPVRPQARARAPPRSRRAAVGGSAPAGPQPGLAGGVDARGLPGWPDPAWAAGARQRGLHPARGHLSERGGHRVRRTPASAGEGSVSRGGAEPRPHRAVDLRHRPGPDARAGLPRPRRLRGAAHRLPRARRLRPGLRAEQRDAARLHPRHDQRGPGGQEGAVRRPGPGRACSVGRWAAASP